MFQNLRKYVLPLLALIAMSACTNSASIPYDNITVSVDGAAITLSDRPAVIEETVYVPVESIGQSLGYDVSWDKEAKAVSLTSKPALVVGTFNIDVKSPQNLVTDQRDLLAGYGVEIFGVQEVDVNLPRYDQDVYDPFTDFAAGTYNDSYFGMSIAKKGEGGYGNGIVSVYDLKDTSVTELYGAAQAPQELQEEIYATYKLWDMNSPEFKNAMNSLWSKDGAMAKGGIEPRTYSRAVFEKDGKEIAFYSVHLTVESADVRKIQLQELRAALDNDPAEYKIIVGDFNADQGIGEYDIFTEGGYKIANGNRGVWYDTVHKNEVARTGLGIKTVTNYLDNIIVSGNITINYVQMIRTDLSDHNPLIAGLTLN